MRLFSETVVGILFSLLTAIAVWSALNSANPKVSMHSLTHASVLEATDSKGYVLNKLINECEAAEHWGDPKYRFGWVIHTIEDKVVGFNCQTPKRTARDYRERFATEY